MSELEKQPGEEYANWKAPETGNSESESVEYTENSEIIYSNSRDKWVNSMKELKPVQDELEKVNTIIKKTEGGHQVVHPDIRKKFESLSAQRMPLVEAVVSERQKVMTELKSDPDLRSKIQEKVNKESKERQRIADMYNYVKYGLPRGVVTGEGLQVGDAQKLKELGDILDKPVSPDLEALSYQRDSEKLGFRKAFFSETN